MYTIIYVSICFVYSFAYKCIPKFIVNRAKAHVKSYREMLEIMFVWVVNGRRHYTR